MTIPGHEGELATTIDQRLRQEMVLDETGTPVADGLDDVSTLIGRVGDQEPLFGTDRALGEHHAVPLIAGLSALATRTSAASVVLAIRADYRQALAPLAERARQRGLTVFTYPPHAPVSPRTLAAELKGATIRRWPRRGKCRIVGASALVDAGRALDRLDLGRRMISIVGAVARPAVMRVPIGASIAELVADRGGEPASVLFHNGPLGGVIVDDDASVDLDTLGVTVLPPRHLAVLRATTPVADLARRIAAACVGCRVCTEICPARLDGAAIQPHAIVRARSLGDGSPVAAACIGCRLCDVFCPAGLQPASIVIAAAGEGPAPPPTDLGATPMEGAHARISMEHLGDALGLRSYARAAPLPTQSAIPRRLRVSLVPRRGGPRQAAVLEGEPVKRGDRLARDTETPARTIASPVSGRVSAIDDTTISIDVN